MGIRHHTLVEGNCLSFKGGAFGFSAIVLIEADGHGRVEMTARNMADGIGHRDDGEAEGERNAEQPYTDIRKTGGDDCAAAAGKSKPERTDSFGDIFLCIH